MAERVDAPPQRKPTPLENALFGVTVDQVPSLVPGVLLAAAIVTVATIATDRATQAIGFAGAISAIMVAIILGILVRNTVGVPAAVLPGIQFCLTKLLRLGIIFMGIRLSIYDALKLGAWGIPIVILCVLTGLVFTSYVTHRLNLSRRLGTLIAVGTGICGASAIVATAPAIRARGEEVTYAVANITVFGILAMLLYPYLANLLFSGNLIQAGLFMGTSVHETAQVAGAGLIYDEAFAVTSQPTAADIAVVTKLVRNLLMVVVIPLMAFAYNRNVQEQKVAANRASLLQMVPLFIFGFLALAVVRTLGDSALEGGGLAFSLWDAEAWAEGTRFLTRLSGYTLATAMAGVGLGTAYSAIKGLGVKPFLVGLSAALMVGVSSFVVVLVLGPHVRL